MLYSIYETDGVGLPLTIIAVGNNAVIEVEVAFSVSGRTQGVVPVRFFKGDGRWANSYAAEDRRTREGNQRAWGDTR